jgi:hypothetical protein
MTNRLNMNVIKAMQAGRQLGLVPGLSRRVNNTSDNNIYANNARQSAYFNVNNTCGVKITF